MGALSGVAQEESGYWVPWCVARPSKIGHVHMLFMSVTTRPTFGLVDEIDT